MKKNQFDLLTRHFCNETNADEENEIESMLANDSSLFDEYKELRTSWDESMKLKKNYDVEQRLEILKSKIKQKQKAQRRLLFFRIAAIFSGLILTGSLLWMDFTKQTIKVATDRIERFYLPDSSVVILNAGARLSYRSSRIMKFNREVNLTGEAFFEVEKQIGQKFIVKTNCLSIEVLGTKFNVNSTNNEAEVTLNEGIIHLFNFALPQVDVYMRPNEYVLYNSKQNKLVTQAINANINSIWKEGQINFKDFNLSEISQIIQKIYKKQVIINNKSLLNKTLSGTAPSDDLNIILKGLSEIMGGDIKIVNDTILIN